MTFFLSFLRSSGYFFAVYDLSTSGKCGSNYVVPSIRVGNLRIRVFFNEALDLDVDMLVYCEFPSTLYIGKTGKVTTSFR
jgi:hypothetical protein